jgi:hypothetical protein
MNVTGLRRLLRTFEVAYLFGHSALVALAGIGLVGVGEPRMAFFFVAAATLCLLPLVDSMPSRTRYFFTFAYFTFVALSLESGLIVLLQRLMRYDDMELEFAGARDTTLHFSVVSAMVSCLFVSSCFVLAVFAVKTLVLTLIQPPAAFVLLRASLRFTDVAAITPAAAATAAIVASDAAVPLLSADAGDAEADTDAVAAEAEDKATRTVDAQIHES